MLVEVVAIGNDKFILCSYEIVTIFVFVFVIVIVIVFVYVTFTTTIISNH